MSAGPMLLVLGIAFGLAGIVIAVLAARNRANKTQLNLMFRLVAAALCLALGGFGIWGAFRMPYLQLMPVCAAHLRGIGDAINEYERRHGRRPATLQELVMAELATPKQFLCPLAWRDGQKSWDEASAPSDYSYVADVVAGDPPDWIVAFDNGDHHGDGTRTIICRDGTIEVLNGDAFTQRITQFIMDFATARRRAPQIILK